MKKFGLVGGTGPESTAIYYRDINYMINTRTGGREYPEFTIENINLNRALDYCQKKQYEELTNYLLGAINNLAKSGAEFVALTANTLHVVYDLLKEKSPVPIISIIEATCAEAKHRGLKKVGLIGTIFTMEGTFFADTFIREGIDVITPDGKTRKLVNDKIANELELGIVKEETRNTLVEIINTMKKNDGIEAIILGCTELPLILNDSNTPVPCLDTMQIHIDTLVNRVMK